MAYVPGFTNDIFISFAHADNWDGWVERFQDRLSHRLAQIGAPVITWRDSKLRGIDVFSDEIFTQLQQSVLLISIVSPSSFGSRWCEDERQSFEHFAALNGGFRFGNQLRAIKVVKTPLPADQHRELFGVLGFEFYERETQSHHFHEFDQSSPEFLHLQDKLAQDIKSGLDAFGRYLNANPQKDTVYVATATPDLKPSRDTIVQELEDWGYAVVPQDSEPLRRLASFEAVAKAELAASIFTVHLASDYQKPILEGGQDSITKQYEFALSMRKDRIVWIAPGRQLYSEFHDALKHGMQKGVEILKDCAIEDLKDVIVESLNLRRRQPAPARNRKARVELYLICDCADLDESNGNQRALRIKEYLDEKGLVVMPPPFTHMEWNELEQEHGAQLQLSNAVLLYWGIASENWFRKVRRIIVKEQLRRNKSSSIGRLTEAFYFSSPPLKKSRYRNAAEFVFEQYGDFKPDDLKPMLDRLLTNEENC